MFDLSFLATDKKKLIERLQNRLAHTQTPQARNEIELQIQELAVQAIPYQSCDLEQADQLRAQLLQKINILVGLGKAQAAEPFRMHLRDVEFHMQTLQMQEILAEQERVKPKEAPNLRERSESVRTLKKAQKKKQAFGKERWLVGFDDEPNDKRK